MLFLEILSEIITSGNFRSRRTILPWGHVRVIQRADPGKKSPRNEAAVTRGPFLRDVPRIWNDRYLPWVRFSDAVLEIIAHVAPYILTLL